jgi:hypothetical protein
VWCWGAGFSGAGGIKPYPDLKSEKINNLLSL